MCSHKLLNPLHPIARRYFIRCLSNECKPKKHSVAVIGSAGGVGQPLTLLLKLNPNISELRLHDIANSAGFAEDVSHIETLPKVSHFTGKDPGASLKGGVDIIIVTAGLARKPGMKREDLFKSNAQVAYDVAKAMATNSPDSILLLVTNPVNSLVPVICDVLENAGKLCPSKIFGVSTLDSVRAATFVAQIGSLDPKDVNVPVIGGHSGTTIVPVISRTNPKICIEGEKLDAVVKKIRDAGTIVVKAKGGSGSATLSTAYAISRLTFAVLRALNGESNIVESVYVKSEVYPGLKYLATPLILGKGGIEKNLGVGTLNDYEQKLFCEAVKHLEKDIEVGQKFAKEQLCKEKK